MKLAVYETLSGFQTLIKIVLKSKVIIASALVLITLSSCFFIKPIEFKKVNSFNIAEKSGKVIFTTNLTLYNPNGFQFTVNNADIDVYTEGINLGKLQIPDTVSIGKNKEFTGDFKVEISLVKMLLAGKNVLPKLKKGDINFELKGYVQANVLWLDKKFNVNYKEKININK